MKDNKRICCSFLQELIYGLVDFISEKENIKNFVFDSLKTFKTGAMGQSGGFVQMIYTIDGKIWMRQDILTFQMLDKKTNPLSINCIANLFVLVCYYSYMASGKSATNDESVDEDTLAVLAFKLQTKSYLKTVNSFHKYLGQK